MISGSSNGVAAMLLDAGSDFDATVAVYQGTSLGDLQTLHCDSGGVRIALRAGTEVLIQVGGDSILRSFTGLEAAEKVDLLYTPSGTLKFSAREVEWSDGYRGDAFRPRPNATMATPTSIDPSASFYDRQFLFPATSDPSDPSDCWRRTLYHRTPLENEFGVAYYRYKPPVDQTLFVTAYMWWSSGRFGVYEETPQGLRLLKCSTRTPESGYFSYDLWWETVRVEAGKRYLVQISGDTYYGRHTPTHLSLSQDPLGDFSIRDLAVTSNPGTATVDSRRISFAVALAGIGSGSVEWSVETCPKDPVGAQGCSLLAQGSISVGPDDRGRREVRLDWTPAGCAGDVEIRVHVEPLDTFDPTLSDNDASVGTSVGLGGFGIGTGACPVRTRI